MSIERARKNCSSNWDELSPELQAQLILLSDKEEQCLEDIRLGLLATLSDYQGLKFVKKMFENALMNVKLP
jgi:hypothetical protein